MGATGRRKAGLIIVLPRHGVYKRKAATVSLAAHTRDGHWILILWIILLEIKYLQRGPLSLVSTTEELLDRKVAAPV
jgi:hypothetical protein